MIRRAGLIGDVHTEDALLRRAIAHLRAEGVDALLCVGDVVDGRGDANAALAMLEAEQVLTVRGNHDRWLLERTMRDLPGATPHDALSATAREFLARAERTHRLTTAGGDALLCHGLGRNDMAKLGFDDFGYALESNTPLQELLADPALAFVLHGHSHRRGTRQLGQTLFVNAGTLAHYAEPGFVLVDFERGEAQLFGLLASGEVVLEGVAVRACPSPRR